LGVGAKYLDTGLQSETKKRRAVQCAARRLKNANRRRREAFSMTTFDPKRMAQYRAQLEAAGFRRTSLYLSAQTRALLSTKRLRGECASGTLNRLLTDSAAASRPLDDSPLAWEQRIRDAQRRIRNSKRAARANRPYTVAIKIYRKDGSGVRVTADSIEPFDALPEP
jgi:hypothetical protein